MINVNHKRNWVLQNLKDKLIIKNDKNEIHDIIIILLIYLLLSISYLIIYWLMWMIWRYISLHNSINELRLYSRMIVISILSLSLYEERFERLIILRYLVI